MASISCGLFLAEDWPTFRGPGARGVADGRELPSDWDLESGRNVRWSRSMHVYDLATGEKIYSQRTGATHASSPVAGDGRIYLGTETGQMLVVKAGREFEEPARIEMRDPVMATPAIADGTLSVRTLGGVYAVAKE